MLEGEKTHLGARIKTFSTIAGMQEECLAALDSAQPDTQTLDLPDAVHSPFVHQHITKDKG